jgi:putative RecB family exonuclease
MIALPAPASNGVPTERDRIDELKTTVSASRLNLWQQCRLKFYFRYVLRIKRSQSGAQYVGSLVHLILQAWNMARWKRALIETVALKKQFEHLWAGKQNESKVWWDEGEQEESKKEAWSLLEVCFRDTPIRFDEIPEGVEVAIETDLKHYGLPKLIGILDLIRQGGRIVDFKTTGQTPNPEKAGHLNETQLSCYSVLYRDNTGHSESGLELHQLVKLKTPKLVVTSLPPMTQSQESRLFRIMESYVEGLERGDFVPSPNPMSCSCCEYFNECRKWRGS